MTKDQFTTDRLRREFLSFFESKDHPIVPSDSLVPKDDPTVLFTSAGMNQFKDYFLGKRKDLKRAASCQKCLRTGDLENVGRTASHHSFFEMLGNFSFGDYFKEEAILWAWEFLTKVLGLEEKDLWVSVYKDDDEAYGIWRDKIKVPEDKILKFGAKDNFWPANAPEEGPNGPCGPCSEIYVDRGAKFGCQRTDCKPGCGCGRYVEVWNLVFTQFNRVGVNRLEPLPSKNIDTGMGLERLASVMQGVATNFDTDIFNPIIGEISELIDDPDRRKYANSDKDGISRRNAIADHVRAAVFCIADGVLPSNTGRGYVLKSLIRRSLVHGKLLGFEKPFLYKLVNSVARAMDGGYPEIGSRRENIGLIIKSEEEKFFSINEALREELNILVAGLRESKKDTIPGEKIFYLHDTRGLPIDLVKEFAQDEGLKLDMGGYERLMEEQRRKSRGATKLTGEIFAETLSAVVLSTGIKSEFVGYDKMECEATVKAIIKDNKMLDSVKAPAEVAILLDETPFYGESGGQVGDTGILEGDGFELEVVDTKLVEKVPVHICKLKEAQVRVGAKVKARVDKERRMAIERHHTATHLLQAALRKILGAHVNQSGSLVTPERLRFDFTHFKPVDGKQLSRIEEAVNGFIRQNAPLKVDFMDLEQAKKAGATALFGEKYDYRVRVITIDDISKELCGGTHLEATGQIGIFRIIGEESVAAGLRRIEAVAGEAAYKRIKESEDELRGIAEALNVKPQDICAQIEKLVKKITDLEKKLKDLESKNIKEKAKDLASKREILDNNISLVSGRLTDFTADALALLTDAIKAESKENTVSILVSSFESKAYAVVGVTKDLITKGVDAKAIVQKISKIISGGGGGRPDLAQSGGRDVSKLEDALKAGVDQIKGLII